LKILFIPDTQTKDGVPLDHLTWIGKYIVDKRPDVIVHAGDHYDMPSLSGYDAGKKCFEGRTYKRDIEVGNHAMDLLMAPILANNARAASNHRERYKPRLVFLLGNHEQRIERAIESDRKLDGVLGYHDFNLTKYGWEVHPFLKPVEINGVHFAHYFYNPMSGHPYGGMVQTRLKNIGFSFVMGHQQGKQQAEMYLSDGTVHRGLVAGSCYQHDEDYKGPQANHHWRGVCVLHEVRNGNYDLMEVSLDFLKHRYGEQA
jgi:Calcineurin-like phosphoesterase